MKLLIDIPEHIYEHAKETTEDSRDEFDAMRAIANGTQQESSSEIPNTCGDAVSRAIVQEEITKSIELKENPYQLWYRIQALPSVTPEPCGDAISRQAVLDLMRGLTRWCVRSEDGKWNNVGLLYDDVMFGIDRLSSVTPQQRTGRWIPVSERLPEDHDWYVIVVKEKSTGYQYIPRIATHNHDNCWSIIDTEDADKEWLDDLECIAWMPLPQPYKAESEVDS